MKKQRRRVGDIVKITLESGSFCFGRVLQEPLMAFYDLNVPMIPDIDSIISARIIFKVWVMRRAITSGRWQIIGNREVDAETACVPVFFKQDAVSKTFSKYFDDKEIPATGKECLGLERAAVWDPEHIEDRLRDHFAGRSNVWVESLKPA